MPHIYRKQMIEGESIIGIIHNGGYHVTPLAVYEDGTVSCWEKNDLQQFKASLRRGWVVPQVPDGQYLSIFKLGAFPVVTAKWLYNTNTYYKHIVEIVRSMNPEMKNLYTETKRLSEKWEQAHVRWCADPTDCKRKSHFGYALWDGTSTMLFCSTDGRTELTFLTVYEDAYARVAALGDTDYTLAQIEELFRSGVLKTSVQEGEWVHIPHLGMVQLAPSLSRVIPPMEKYCAIEQMLLTLTGKPTAREQCREAYYAYLASPSEQAREHLRAAYEAVPEHERIYLGDMDSHDSDYRRILYHPEMKREV